MRCRCKNQEDCGRMAFHAKEKTLSWYTQQESVFDIVYLCVKRSSLMIKPLRSQLWTNGILFWKPYSCDIRPWK